MQNLLGGRQELEILKIIVGKMTCKIFEEEERKSKGPVSFGENEMVQG